MNRAQKVLCALCACGAGVHGLIAQQTLRLQSPTTPQKPSIVAGVRNLISPQTASLGTVSATPSTISFSAGDPDLGSVSGSSASTVSWTTSSGSSSSSWTLKVQASATSFTNCSTVPVSAVTATCSSVSGGSSGACKSAITLSTTSQEVATGKESTSSNAPYSVSLSFTLANSWSYIAQQSPSCTLTLTYTVSAP
jgi:hypothetical protein